MDTYNLIVTNSRVWYDMVIMIRNKKYELLLAAVISARATLILISTAMLEVVLLAVQQGDLKGGFVFGLFSGVTYALAIIAADRAGTFCTLSPAIAALLGVVILHERLGILGHIGLALILTSIILPYLRKK